MRLGRRYKLQLDLKTMAVTLVVVLLLAPLPSSVMPQWPNKKLEAADRSVSIKSFVQTIDAITME